MAHFPEASWLSDIAASWRFARLVSRLTRQGRLRFGRTRFTISHRYRNPWLRQRSSLMLRRLAEAGALTWTRRLNAISRSGPLGRIRNGAAKSPRVTY